MGIFSQAQSQLKKAKLSVSQEDAAPEGSDPDETSVLDENEGSIILAMVSQLRPGMDLQKISFPTFVLEPRSMLERITDFMSHPELIFGADQLDDPQERFIRVLQYYLSGWHIKPKGVKKPYNPVLGEFFRGRYEYPDGSQGFYIAEQVSHHPPISAFFYTSPANNIRIIGELRPKSKFLGNSVQTVMEGANRVSFTSNSLKRDDGEYIITMPNMYGRGILFGRMVLELGDDAEVRNDVLGLKCTLDFKTKGFFSGTYNTVAGRVRASDKDIGELSGRWSHAMQYKSRGGESRSLFDAKTDGAKVAPIIVAPEEEQEPLESRRLWSKLTEAIQTKNMDAATEAKNAVEESQRERRKQQEDTGQQHVTRFFEYKGDHWVPKFQLPTDSKEAVQAVQQWMWQK